MARRIHNLIFTLLAITLCTSASAQVSHAVMEQIYNEVKTPYKYGLVVAPTTNSMKYDCPTVFREGDMWYMTYVCYNGKGGKDGRGYETWIASSPDLLHWQTLGRVLEFPTTDTWDANQRGGFPALIDWTWGGNYAMQKYKGRHWMTYIGGSGTGYESVNAPLSIGLASTKGNIAKVHPWDCMGKPLMSYDDKDAQWWEQLTQYKSTIYKADKRLLGYPFVMFYNAGGKDETHPKGERIGIALSKDMLTWKRYEGNPVFAHDSDGTITGDAQIVKMQSMQPTTHNLQPTTTNPLYVMFYFSAFNPTRKYNAYNTFAASYDLIHWTDWDGEDLIVPSKPYDEMFAHKSCVVKHNGTVYHFYCAVDNAEQRGIALATSRHMGKSEVRFPAPDPSGQRFTQSLNENWEVVLNGTNIRKNVDVPYNLDDYYGALQKEHGNLHGTSTWTKHFFAKNIGEMEYFIRFEGVGTYADITLNGTNLGRYDIGRTSQTIDVTKAVVKGGDNVLQLNISHPEGITDMPWVCGGCSSEWGFSEGSQPFGIFRPVTLEVTDKVRIEPFGVHVWSNLACDSVFIETEIRNYGETADNISLINKLCEKGGKQVVRLTENVTLQPGETKIIRQQASLAEINVNRWSLKEPYLYNVNTLLKRNNKTTDNLDTPFGFRTSQWPKSPGAKDNCFYLNGEKTFIDGVCEYEHLFGQSHAFTHEQIETRISQVVSAGFNAFRDAHQPHNLYYKELLDKKGILWWAQFSAHIWYDTPQFRESFKRHLRQWVKERRNSPSLVLWGLQNESTLPKDFAEECTAIIREMDPTCGTQRLVATCNGGEGTDWNVVQNWSGTYGGDIEKYADELKQPDQLLNGEYGAWRTLGNHTGEGYTEEKYLGILSKKVTLAEEAKDAVCGQFLWLLNSHDNPGRRQPDEALRVIDKVGPFNYKGLFTIWDQPTDAFYWYKDRGAARDSIFSSESRNATAMHKNRININCGGDEFVDSLGNVWLQDNTTFSHSWGDRFEGISSYQCSQTYCPELPISPLYHTSRFGRHELYYHIPANKGKCTADLYFVEPWYKGTHDDSDYEGWRLFDVAINDSTVIHDLDIWSQVGYGKVYKRTVEFFNNADTIKISFPRIKSGQAIIAAISIESENGFPEIAPNKCKPTMWADFNQDIMVKTPDSLLPPSSKKTIEVEGAVKNNSVEWAFSVGVAKVYAMRFKYYNPKQPRKLHVKITDQNGVIY
ncbi:MAG: malectin domain-containing carbohydrate-binding protein, partial [Prevotellaceae bacterium]|nr:malectin domain-containing carbohydrate-binding protein [Prevotellaceae bacterium]